MVVSLKDTNYRLLLKLMQCAANCVYLTPDYVLMTHSEFCVVSGDLLSITFMEKGGIDFSFFTKDD